MLILPYELCPSVIYTPFDSLLWFETARFYVGCWTFPVERDEIDSELLKVGRKRICVFVSVCVSVWLSVRLQCDSSVLCSRWVLAVEEQIISHCLILHWIVLLFYGWWMVLCCLLIYVPQGPSAGRKLKDIFWCHSTRGGQLCSLFTVLDFYCTHHFCHFHLRFNANNAADGDRFKVSLFSPNSVEVWVTFSYS